MKIVVLSLLMGVAAARAQHSAPPAPSPSYDNFKLVRLRNIFDPDRRGLRGDAVASAPRSGGPLPNSISVTGSMVTDGRKLAFFSGARPEYNCVLGVNGKIADFNVEDITDSQVKLHLGSRSLTVNVGQNVPLTGSSAASLPGTLAPSDSTASGSFAPPSPSSSSSIVSGGPPAPPPGGSEEVMRRMIERRQKELGK